MSGEDSHVLGDHMPDGAESEDSVATKNALTKRSKNRKSGKARAKTQPVITLPLQPRMGK